MFGVSGAQRARGLSHRPVLPEALRVEVRRQPGESTHFPSESKQLPVALNVVLDAPRWKRLDSF